MAKLPQKKIYPMPVLSWEFWLSPKPAYFCSLKSLSFIFCPKLAILTCRMVNPLDTYCTCTTEPICRQTFFHSYCVCVCVRVSAWTLIINPVHPKISERPESMESLVKQIPWNSNFRLIIYSKRRSVKVLIRCAFKIILMAMLQDGFEKGHQRTNLTVQSKE